MRIQEASVAFFLAAAVLLCLFCTPAVPVQAQSAGNNAVYTGTPTATVTGSSAYIDATAWAGTGTSLPDFCDVLSTALNAASSTPVVIDARGLTTKNTTMACGGMKTPWSAAYSVTTPSTILLPPGTIAINATWVIPDKTRIIGASRTNTSIAVSSTFNVSTYPTMLQMGSSNTTFCPNSGVCTGVSISDLRLDGQGANSTALVVTGILNENSQDESYVSHVTFHYLEKTALDIETSGANNSGPYTDLTPSAGGSCTPGTMNCSGCTGFDGEGSTACSSQSSTTTCIKIVGAQTKGIHGFTCTAGYLNANGSFSAVGPNAGIYLDGGGNTIEDGHFEGVKDGIVVGDQQTAAGNVILNITGGANTAGSSGQIDNIVHICAASGSTSPCQNTGSVSDLTLSEIQSYTTSWNAILDEETSRAFTSTSSGRPFYVGAGAGLYALGESTTAGYSGLNTFWFPPTTSTPVPTWAFANNTTTAPTGTCPVGSIFSNGGGASGSTLYVCVGSSGGGSSWSNLK
jgi:hypothetical protein